MIVLSIDQSYTCSGIVVLNDGHLEHCEVFKTTKDADRFDRAAELANRISTLFLSYSPDEVRLENLAFGTRGNVTRDLAGLLFAIIVICKSDHPTFTYKLVAPTSVKKFATNSGKASKSDMINALPNNILEKFAELGVKKTTGLADLADAYHIGTYEVKVDK